MFINLKQEHRKLDENYILNKKCFDLKLITDIHHEGKKAKINFLSFYY